MPKISVIMPVHNGEKYLHESIKSILGQTFTDFEFLIMDDGSTDSTAKILKKYAAQDPRIKLFHQINQGIVKSLNTLIAHTQADFIARMDADDIALPERFQEQINYLNQNPKTVVVGCLCKIFKENDQKNWGTNTAFQEDFFNRWFLSIIPCFIHSAVLIRKKQLIQCGQYKSADFPAEDYGLWVRLKRFGKIETIPKNLMLYRLTSEGISGKNFPLQIKIRDYLNFMNLTDIYKHHEIPTLTQIKNCLTRYSLSPHQKKVIGKLACLTGCYLVEKGAYSKAKPFFKFALTLDKRRIDAISNLIIGHFGKAFLISIDHYPLGKKYLTKIHWFNRKHPSHSVPL